ncbi:hypothetical protein NU10_04290 [Flavobacterium dauae]|uniref:hypothetical protein n=1 Tax=Flavobacterium dauae TaxID=1563479 RepID=UPI00101E1086|nr:hypothetical protein [Flavobacterium dauae]WLD24621.1 hypothetical protein NU10_04290 [Flavobacterium dauae]
MGNRKNKETLGGVLFSLPFVLSAIFFTIKTIMINNEVKAIKNLMEDKKINLYVNNHKQSEVTKKEIKNEFEKMRRESLDKFVDTQNKVIISLRYLDEERKSFYVCKDTFHTELNIFWFYLKNDDEMKPIGIVKSEYLHNNWANF